MRILIKDLFPYDGEHDCGGPYSMEEVYTFKRVAEVRPTEYEEALRTGDVGIVVALAIVALKRKDHDPINEVLLWKSKVGQVLLDFSDEGDAIPPPVTNGNSPLSSDESTPSIGQSGSDIGDPSDSDPSGTGTPSPDDTE